MTSLKILISGKVQGVGFRYYLQNQAKVLGLSGWVRNLPNGQVEVLIQGQNRIDIAAFRDYCKIGPPRARVDSCQSNEIVSEEYSNFSIR